MANESIQMNCNVLGCWAKPPTGPCMAKTAVMIALAVGIIVTLAGVLGVMGTYNVFPQDLAWLGSAGANGLEYAIVTSALGLCLAVASTWLLKTEPWR